MSGVAVMTVTPVAATSWRHARREFRHRTNKCSRLLFVGYLPPGTYIEIRCPACGRIHVIEVAADPIDIEP